MRRFSFLRRRETADKARTTSDSDGHPPEAAPLEQSPVKTRSPIKRKGTFTITRLATNVEERDSATNAFKHNVMDFQIEGLVQGGENVVFGPRSNYSGRIKFRCKQNVKDVEVWVVLYGTVEADGGLLKFLNITEKLFQGDLNAGPHSFLFGLRFPAVNLPPSSTSPHLSYSLVAQIRPISEDLLAAKPVSSKPQEITFIPFIDPTPFEITDKSSKDKVSRNGTAVTSGASKEGSAKEDDSPTETTAGGRTRPILKLATKNLGGLQNQSEGDLTFMSTSRTRVLKTVDDANNPVTFLSVKIAKSKFVPSAVVEISVKLSIHRPGLTARYFEVSLLEKRWVEQDSVRITDVSTSTIETRRMQIPPIETVDPKKQKKATAANKEAKDDDIPEPLIRYEHVIKAKLPSFEDLINDVRPPSAALPLGPATPMTPKITHSSKGKAAASASVTGLKFVVAHYASVSVCIPGAPSLPGSPTNASPSSASSFHAPFSIPFLSKRATVQTLELPLFIGNKSPTTNTPLVKVTPPESAVPPHVVEPKQNTLTVPPPVVRVESYGSLNSLNSLGSGSSVGLGSSSINGSSLSPYNFAAFGGSRRGSLREGGSGLGSSLAVNAVGRKRSVSWQSDEGETFGTLEKGEKPRFLTGEEL